MTPERIQTWSRAAAAAALAAALLVFLCALIAGAWGLRGAPAHLVAAAKSIDEAAGESRTLIARIRRDYEDPDGIATNMLAGLMASAAASRNADELLADIRTGLMGGRDTRGVQRAGVFPQIEALIGDLRDGVRAFQADLDRLTVSADETLAPLRLALERTAALVDTLDKEIRDNSRHSQETLAALTRSIEDLDRLLADPAIAQTLANVEGVTHHTSGAMESVDIALRPWRKKANQLKFVLGKLIGFFRVVLPL